MPSDVGVDLRILLAISITCHKRDEWQIEAQADDR
jgi:hypothetical protein